MFHTDPKSFGNSNSSMTLVFLIIPFWRVGFEKNSSKEKPDQPLRSPTHNASDALLTCRKICKVW